MHVLSPHICVNTRTLSQEFLRRMAKHIAEKNIENLALGRLRTHDSIRVHRHLYTCSACLKHLIEITFALALKGLTPKTKLLSDARKPLYIVHDTADGFIYSKQREQAVNGLHGIGVMN